MVLKDKGGLVKLYAMVNVEQYNIVATGATQEEAKAAYLDRLVAEGVLSPENGGSTPPADDSVTLTVTLDAITPVTAKGETVLYLRGKDADGSTLLFKASVAEQEALLFLSVGDTVTFTAAPTQATGVYSVISHEKQ